MKSPIFAFVILYLDAVDDIRVMVGQIFIEAFNYRLGNFTNVVLDILGLQDYC